MPQELSASGGTIEAVGGVHIKHAGLMALSLGSLGVVYGDIGTSPLMRFARP